MDDKLKKALLKKAKGYTANEVQEEYAAAKDGKLELVKKKITKKYYPPDGAALKSYLELETGGCLSSLTDEELEKEKARLLNALTAEKKEKQTKEKTSAKKQTEQMQKKSEKYK